LQEQLGLDFGHSISMLSIFDYWDLSLEFFVDWAGFVSEKLIGVKLENELGLKREYMFLLFFFFFFIFFFRIFPHVIV
jgi:hypothetical protein